MIWCSCTARRRRSIPTARFSRRWTQSSARGRSPIFGVSVETVEEARRLAELFLAMIRGEKLSEDDLEDLDEAAQLQDISHMPARVKCAELAWRTLDGMLEGQANQ